MKNLIYLCFLFFLSPLLGQEYIQVTSSDVNIRIKASSSSTVVGLADNGRIFEFKGEESGWFKVLITSGEYRYIHGSLCKKVNYTISLPSESIQRSLFKTLLVAEDMATVCADKKYPSDIMKNIDYQRILDDKYKLEVFIKLDLHPTIYSEVIGKGAKERW